MANDRFSVDEGPSFTDNLFDDYSRAAAERDAALARAEAAEARVAEAERLAALLGDWKAQRAVVVAAMKEDSGVPRAEYRAACEHLAMIVAELTAAADAFLAGAPAAPPESLAAAVLAYDDAIRSCADDPSKMASFCTAEGDTLDKLYADMLRLAGHPERAADAVASPSPGEGRPEVAPVEHAAPDCPACGPLCDCEEETEASDG